MNMLNRNFIWKTTRSSLFIADHDYSTENEDEKTERKLKELTKRDIEYQTG